MLRTKPARIQINRFLAIEETIPKDVPRKIKMRMINNIAESSSKNYQRCWEKFVVYANKWLRNHSRQKLVLVYKFFNSLVVKGYKFNTLLAYRCALKRPIRSLFPEFCIEKDEHLQNLLVYAKTHCKKPEEVVLWDLDRVLGYVASIPITNLRL